RRTYIPSFKSFFLSLEWLKHSLKLYLISLTLDLVGLCLEVVSNNLRSLCLVVLSLNVRDFYFMLIISYLRDMKHLLAIIFCHQRRTYIPSFKSFFLSLEWLKHSLKLYLISLTLDLVGLCLEVVSNNLRSLCLVVLSLNVREFYFMLIISYLRDMKHLLVIFFVIKDVLIFQVYIYFIEISVQVNIYLGVKKKYIYIEKL
ncbi:hypothetical protein V8G54_006773, partial [Vigna mungo]